MSKFSVKKPFTVFVAVVIILVTGIVSYTKMTPDLFPNIDMPYVIVVTPYAGATPEKVENNVTKPLEQRLATLTDIKDLQSVSNANYSMVMLEFEDSVNMDTVSSDILQKINLVEGNWEDAVGTPTIMKLNPNMIPVSVAAVDYKGKDRAELSSFVSDTLMNQLEGITGVASIDTSGILEEKVNVVISQDKIDKINNKILASVNSQLASAQSELDAQKGKVQQGKSQLADQQKKIDDGKAQLEKAKAQLEEGKPFLPEEQYK
ncbi:MAG: efflux RND transporter permease subunit, partial [Emergencia timonensis]